jgi:quercetin dioxygenase-like cupin family protein
MRLIKAESKEIVSRPGEDQRFTGRVLIQDLIAGRFEKDINVYRVRFQPGALTHWHRHPGGQVLYVVSGVGRIGAASQNLEQGQRELFEIRPGDVIWTDSLEWHWHGAGPDQEMTHIAISPTVSPELLKDHHQEDWSREVTLNEYNWKNQQSGEKS